MRELDAKKLQVGMRVITVKGDRTGTVKAFDIENNICAVLFDGDNAVTRECQPSRFRVTTIPVLRRTGMPPPGTVPRGSL